MNPINPVIKLHTFQQDQGIFLNSIVIEHQGHCYHMEGCTGDTIYVYQQSISLYVLNISKAHAHISLQSYMKPEPDPINTVTLRNKEISETLGEKWESMKPIVMVRKLIEYLY